MKTGSTLVSVSPRIYVTTLTGTHKEIEDLFEKYWVTDEFTVEECQFLLFDQAFLTIRGPFVSE